MRKDDVARFDVAMNHTVLMSVLQAESNLDDDIQGHFRQQKLFAFENIVQRFAFAVFHRVKIAALRVADVECRNDIEMIQPSGCLCFVFEAAQKFFDPASFFERIFSATLRWASESSARYTVPIMPWPIFLMSL